MKRLTIFLEERQTSLNKLRNNVNSFNWGLTLLVIYLYSGGLIGLYYLLSLKAKFWTYVWVYHYFVLGGIGLGPGAHRFFSHRSYKATRAFKLFLIMCNCIAGQFSLVFWCRVHRTHHKYTDTKKDPTNIENGFFFAHFSWIFRFTPECKKALETVDVNDLLSDKDVMFQYKYLYPLNALFCNIIPTIVPYLLWNETLWIAFMTNIFRWTLNYNQMSLANSLMHMIGTKPYDKAISAAENLFCIIFTYGEGYHNYHHCFPWDYRSAESGDLLYFNLSTVLLDLCAKLGWVYDRKVVTEQMIERRKKRTGDGHNYLTLESSRKNSIWGFGDVDMDEDDKKELHAFVDENNN